MASYELGQKAKSWSFFKKEDMKTSYMEIDDKHFELMHDGKKPRMLARVEYTHDGYQFRYWIEIVES